MRTFHRIVFCLLVGTSAFAVKTVKSVRAAGDPTVGYWRFESAAALLTDASGNDLALTVSGTAPTFLARPATGNGSALQNPIPQNGATNAGAASLAGGSFTRADSPLYPTANLTIEAYVTRTTTTSATQYIASQYATTGNQRSWGFGVAGTAPPAGTVAGELFFLMSADGSANKVVGSGLIVPVNTDYYVAAVLDLKDTATGLRFYTKNLLTGASAASSKAPAYAALFASTATLNIGAYDGSSNRWVGLLDEVRLSNVALAATALLINGNGPVTTEVPAILPAEHGFVEPIDVTMSCATEGAAIRYTVDGSLPTEQSPLYTGPVRLTTSATVKARAFKSGLEPSFVGSSSYTVAGYTYLGKVQPRSALEIAASNWSVGCETLDRDYADFSQYKQYLGPLGAKKVRLQAGWAKTEKSAGAYSWDWLDTIVNYCVAQGVKPWLQTSYGNTIYTGGGGISLGSGLPTSTTALAAWDAWVRALVQRYRDRVTEWEIWNEPDGGSVTSTAYADFFVRTATIIRAEQPQAKILAIGMSNIGSTSYLNGFLTRVQELGQLGLVDQITHHGYPTNPDTSYASVAKLQTAATSFSPTIKMRQGESGSPSTYGSTGALGNFNATETIQAKWNLRRMLGDLGRDLESNVFTLMDFFYPQGINTKGLIKSNSDKTVAYLKPAYYAVQNVTSIFDSTLTRVPTYAYTSTAPAALSVYGYVKAGTGQQVVTIWFNSATPVDTNDRTGVDFTFSNGAFTDPVYVDLREGRIYDVPSSQWSRQGTSCTFLKVPCYDSPIAIADKSVLIMPVDHWRQARFSEQERVTPGIAGLLDDPEGDHWNNLLEYAFGTAPKDATGSDICQSAPYSGGGEQYLSLSYLRNRDATDLVYTPQVSTDLIDWRSGPEYFAEVSQSADRVTVRTRQPLSAPGNLYVRLLVEIP